jgi:hypothetical protein
VVPGWLKLAVGYDILLRPGAPVPRVAGTPPGRALPRLRFMHGMLSLAVLVAAFVGLAGWATFVAVRLYRACPAARQRPPKSSGLT